MRRTPTSGWIRRNGARSSAPSKGLEPARSHREPAFRAPQCGQITTTARSGTVINSVRSAAHSGQTPSVRVRPVAPQTTQNSPSIVSAPALSVHREDLGVRDSTEQPGPAGGDEASLLSESEHPLPQEVRDRGSLECPEKFLTGDGALPVELSRDSDRPARVPDGKGAPDELGVAGGHHELGADPVDPHHETRLLGHGAPDLLARYKDKSAAPPSAASSTESCFHSIGRRPERAVRVP